MPSGVPERQGFSNTYKGLKGIFATLKLEDEDNENEMDLLKSKSEDVDLEGELYGGE